MTQKLLRKALFSFFFILGGAIYSQTVTGTVSDVTGPMPGVNVIVKGTTNGTQTDFDGKYTLNNVASDAIIVFSSLGFKTQEIAVNGQTAINVTLVEDAAALEEVVVIGYGSTTVQDATGAVAAVSSKDFNSGVISSPEQLIQGKTAGVQMTQSSGEPGAGIAFRIRGSNSIRSNNNPLFVVDGIPLPTQGTTPAAGGIVDGGDTARNPLSFLNPNDIESISILKDASATAIYGSRAANGVVIITTKNGRSGREGKFEFTTNISHSSPANEYDLFNASEYRAQQLAVTGNPVPSFDDAGGDTDWQDVITRGAISIDNNLAYSKNYGNGNIRGTFSYTNQQGVVENSSQERITGRLNASHRFFDEKLTVNLQLSASRVNDETPQISGQSGASGNLIGAAYSAPPTWPNDPNFFVAGNRLNPRNILDNFLGEGQTTRYLLNGSLEYSFTNELSAKVNLGYDKSDAVATSAVSANYNNSGRITDFGQASRNELEATSKLLEATLNYNKALSDDFTLNALVGYSFQDFQREGFNAQGWGIGNAGLEEMNDVLENSVNSINNALSGSTYIQYGYDQNGSWVNEAPDISNTAVLPAGVSGRYQSLWYSRFENFPEELQSFFGRVNLTYKDKFLLTATFRADGSSKFSESERYGYFPSAAFAWKISEEDFIGDNVSTLKLRLGAGVVGNQSGLAAADAFFTRSLQGPGISNDGTVVRPGSGASATPSPTLKWETTADYNIGLDFGFNDDRFRGTIDFYRKETSDLLFLSPAAAPAQQPFVFKNLEDGIVVNQGVEFTIGYDFINSDDTVFSADFNISYNDNVVKDLQPGFTADLGPLNGPGLTGAFAQRIAEGQPLFAYYMAEYSETDGVPDFSADDKDFVGKSALPDINAGLSLNFRKGNWDASAYFTGQFGFYVYNNTANAFLNRPTFETSRNGSSESLGLLSQEVSTLYLEKGDFVRLQSLSVGYNFTLGEDSALDSFRLTLSGQNVFLITDYSGLDPEVSTNTGAFANGIPSAGIDYTSFPRPRTFSLGINATF
ncbi:MAG: SusC/RagA family TonB-linked outer membrane protein [Winogradskyella sp.]|uniref:SusC/RagA family TonB-linked outer membrane protein n=1 Tax=Winogradskyella sp. TaxID=1883156 RepID=UPI0025D2FCCC|nr:SusC/RagA family TonB-linked outer membrane protein [Winogradskyella sp.]NRB84145.1 SusC/RagA family TonB-linked outer membrane protein [Winogradskyella sp.]